MHNLPYFVDIQSPLSMLLPIMMCVYLNIGQVTMKFKDAINRQLCFDKI